MASVACDCSEKGALAEEVCTPGSSGVLRHRCMCCRPQSEGQDEVAAGALHNNVLQRMKLNNKVALITGELPW